MRIDAAELLTWVQEQSEEKSINLTKFTEHFNNMSYWTRTLILKQPDAKVCELIIFYFIISYSAWYWIGDKIKESLKALFALGTREIFDEVYQNYEVAEKNEQFQLLLGHPVCPRLCSHPKTW